MKKKYIGVLAALAVMISTLATAENSLVVSGSKLDIEQFEKKFDRATVTITGPDGFEKQMRVNANNTELDIEQLGIIKDGNYSYQIEYSQLGELEIVNDRKNGRQGAIRNLGKVESKSGYFNVKDSEFVQGLEYEGELGQEPKVDQIVDKNNFEIVDEQLAK
ncbi:hypothetical protein MK852_06730 [Shewanella benthica]|uniref:hypothetical protein n=1 Tax=Shewanella benthica TaxID=43661 RepID=UPI001879705C|nr:hypothetical protein [Shewanella benthica]MBE7213926.1 hypothetical protein [Shewanella benthica]MCL1061832.1 hypothetical protein [Shewanella benthica]